jgi:hypothetical protein
VKINPEDFIKNKMTAETDTTRSGMKKVLTTIIILRFRCSRFRVRRCPRKLGNEDKDN